MQQKKMAHTKTWPPQGELASNTKKKLDKQPASHLQGSFLLESNPYNDNNKGG
jgi:hypothetical protein